jgi:hypothetical protein
MFKKIFFFVEDMDLFVTLNVATFKNILWKWERKIRAMLPYVIWGKTDIKLLFGNAGNNKENNCKPDHNRSELLCHWLVKDK